MEPKENPDARFGFAHASGANPGRLLLEAKVLTQLEPEENPDVRFETLQGFPGFELAKTSGLGLPKPRESSHNFKTCVRPSRTTQMPLNPGICYARA